MDSLSISVYRNLEQLTLRQNAAFTKSVANNSYIQELREEPVPVTPATTLSKESVQKSSGVIEELVMIGQKLNLLA